MTATSEDRPPAGSEARVVPVFFLSDSTGISAETMGNALLIQFPDLHFERRLIPFISSVEEARKVVEVLDAAAAGPVTPLAFSTTALPEIREELHKSVCPLIDFFDLHMSRVGQNPDHHLYDSPARSVRAQLSAVRGGLRQPRPPAAGGRTARPPVRP